VDSERDLSELEDDLHAMAEDLFVDAGELKAIEKVKAELPVDHPRQLVLAKKANELGEKIAAKTAAELALAKDAAAG
jgi:hypothetical protein